MKYLRLVVFCNKAQLKGFKITALPSSLEGLCGSFGLPECRALPQMEAK